jgi:hypothetical protein
MNNRFAAAACLVISMVASTSGASAHVKWFAPYIVGAPPQPMAATLGNVWFWTGLALVLIFFVATRLVERSAAGPTILNSLDRITDPLWRRLDDFIRIVVAAFFVAIFAVGGVYLTPDLKTPAEWVSWAQLIIAMLIFSRRTQPMAAAGIIGLWLLALRDYDVFHLLDYLALGVGVAAYLVLETFDRSEWRQYRFLALRWGVAIALMWSSLEKFAYPDWFYPLVEEKPFLTFGLPRDVFIPMAGVAEFTMGFGLLWTPLVRRLSAIALFIIFNAAVYPFGRIDLVGHALIMAIIVAIAADHSRGRPEGREMRQPLAAVPAGLAMAIVVIASSYWGLHIAIYGLEGRTSGPAVVATHSHSPEHPHGPATPAGIGAPPTRGGEAPPMHEAYRQVMQRMHEPMMEGMANPDPDAAFILGMMPHHQGAIDMAEIQLRHGTDPQARALAMKIIIDQRRELEEMRQWLRSKNLSQPAR